MVVSRAKRSQRFDCQFAAGSKLNRRTHIARYYCGTPDNLIMTFIPSLL
jgi:hypothetical protein